MGLASHTQFSDITSDEQVTDALASVYQDVDEIDLWVGVLAEEHVENAMVGELAWHVLASQFRRLRDGDRFWYENVLTGDELAADLQADAPVGAGYEVSAHADTPVG